MKYYNTPLEEQETTINLRYDEEILEIYTNRVDVIKNLTTQIGKPTIKYKKNKTYWLGASWKIRFKDIKKLNEIVNKTNLIDKNFKEKIQKTEEKDGFEQILIKF